MVSQLSSCLPVPVSEGSVALRGVGFISHRTSPALSFLRLPRHTVDVIPPVILGCIRWFPHRVSSFLAVAGYSYVCPVTPLT